MKNPKKQDKTSLIPVLVFMCLNLMAINLGFGQFVQIRSILVDACGSNEGLNEMVYFTIESNAINVADIRVDGSMNGGMYQIGKWPNNSNSFLGWISPGTAAYDTAVSKIAQINATIENCGKLIIPTGGANNQGILPAGKKGIIITSTDFSPFANSFTTLRDTLYVLFQNPGNTTEHFANYANSSFLRSIKLVHMPTGYIEAATYNLSYLVDQIGMHIAEDGAGVRFSIPGDPTYFNDGCIAPFPSQAVDWVPPTSVCHLSSPLDLNTLLIDSSMIGGTWSGVGVTGNHFNPAGLSGNINITYTACSQDITHPIFVLASSTANCSWTPPLAICQSVNATLMTSLLNPSATPGGTWSGPGITGVTLNTFGLVGDLTYTYTVGVGLCSVSESHIITISPIGRPYWTSPNYVCQSGAPINLNSLLYSTSTRGGIWSGPGVTDSIFNPGGLSGNVVITYTSGVVPCLSSESHSIFVLTSASSSWTPPDTLCQAHTPIILDSILTDSAVAGGVWTGTGVLSGVFYPQDQVGTNLITYTIGSNTCTSTQSHNITVISTSYTTWTPPATAICQFTNPIPLNSLLASTSTHGGVWSGPGVSAGILNPSGLSGIITVTYTVGTSPCIASESHNITVIPTSNALWTAPLSICKDSPILNLNQFLSSSATPGGIWSGIGVTGNQFNPALSTSFVTITYSVGTSPCVSSVSHDITIVPTANPAWDSPGGLCQSATAINLNTLLTDSSTQGGLWSGVGVNNNIFIPDELSGPIDITYSVGTAPCIKSESHAIYVSPTVDASWNPIPSTCSEDVPIDLSPNITFTPGGIWHGPGMNSSWFDPSGLSGQIPITYTVHNTHCFDSVTHYIQVISNPTASLEVPSLICVSSTVFDLNSIINGTPGGIWSGNGINSNIINIDTSGNPISIKYYVNNSGCADSVSAILNFGYVYANFDLTPTTGYAPLEVATTNLSANAVSYQWTFGNGETSTDFEASTRFLYEGTYYVWLKATSAVGCVDSTFKALTIINTEDFIPSAFSPDDDGVNDIFIPVISRYTTNYHFAIYNRWGEIVFETQELSRGWDGRYQNTRVPFGVYYYVVEFTSGKNSYYYSGTVTVIE